jgi:hypothetical protein
MKDFLMKNFKTDDIEKVQYKDLKKVVEGDSLLSRIQYRLSFANWLQMKREIVNRFKISNVIKI